jgi:hypothetical protein
MYALVRPIPLIGRQRFAMLMQSGQGKAGKRGRNDWIFRTDGYSNVDVWLNGLVCESLHSRCKSSQGT